MPRRNLLTIFAVALVSLFCYQRAERNPYGRYLNHVLDQIDQNALEPVGQQELFDGAMRGIVGQLDPYSSYISAKQKAEFEADLEQQFGGVGVKIKLEQVEGTGDMKLLVVNPPMPGTPAQEAGIRVGDWIQEIDGQSTRKMTIDDVLKAMRGERGTTVELTVLHEDTDKPVRYHIVRDIIDVRSVEGDRRLADGSWEFRLERNPRIGYVRMTTFGEKTVTELVEALVQLEKQGAQAVVLDLRDNAGGLLDAAVATCELFLHKDQLIVSTKGRGRQLRSTYTTDADGPFAELPLAVLVNDYSASAAEIVAACLQDHHRAIVVGSRSYGKGTVQHVIDIESGKSLLKLTAASYWRPSNKNIHRMRDAKDEDEWGVSPDPGFEVKLTEAEALRVREERMLRDLFGQHEEGQPQDEKTAPEDAAPFDPVLDRAVEQLDKQLKSRAAQPQPA